MNIRSLRRRKSLRRFAQVYVAMAFTPVSQLCDYIPNDLRFYVSRLNYPYRLTLHLTTVELFSIISLHHVNNRCRNCNTINIKWDLIVVSLNMFNKHCSRLVLLKY